MKKKMAQQDSKSKEMEKRVEKIERSIAQLDWQLQDMNNRAEKLKKEMTHYTSQLQEMGNRCESMQDKVAQQGSQFEKASNRIETMKRVLAQQMDHLKERMEKGMREAPDSREGSSIAEVGGEFGPGASEPALLLSRRRRPLLRFRWTHVEYA